MERSRPGMPRFLAALTALALLIAACGGPGGEATPIDVVSPPVGESPTTGESPPTGETPTTGESPPTGETPTTAESPPTGESPAIGESPTAASPGAAPTFENIGGSVSVIGSWTDAEQESFLAMLEPWMEMTGVQVNYVGTRDMQTQLTAAIEGGGAGLPDVAGIPGPGLMQDWFARGALKPLDFIDQQAYFDAAPPGLAELGQTEDGTLAGVFIKAAVKGLIWYNSEVYDGAVPENWDAVQQVDPAPAESRWCVAFESGAASGWPGTDWIEDILLRQSGPEAYDAWVNGELAWTSPEVSAAFEEFREVIDNTAGGGTAIVTTAFQDGGNGLFTDPPQCKFHHQASFMSDFLVERAGATPEQFNFFVMPDINPEFPGAVTGGGDLIGMFNDTPQARSLVQWLVTPQAQEIWASRGGFIAANTNVPVDAYADEPSRKAAEVLAETTAFRFDGSDSMPGAMNEAFFRAMVEFAQSPDNLDSILQNLDTVQQDAYRE